MELKEMEGSWVTIGSKKEYDEYLSIKIRGGWTDWMPSLRHIPYLIESKSRDSWSSVKPSNSNYKNYSIITLAEFKKEQGIMKYKEGDVLVSRHDNEKKVQGVCGEIYFMSDSNDFSKHECGYTETELEVKGWSLKTETTKTDKTVSEIEKDLGLAAGSLNVVADK